MMQFGVERYIAGDLKSLVVTRFCLSRFQPRFVGRHENLIIIGKTGLGNSSRKVAWCGGCRRLAARRLQ
jgi:hypothetical protein